MRKIVLFNNVTVDGFMAGPGGKLDWAVQDVKMPEKGINDSVRAGNNPIGIGSKIFKNGNVLLTYKPA